MLVCGCEKIIEFENTDQDPLLVAKVIVNKGDPALAFVSKMGPLVNASYFPREDPVNDIFAPNGARMILNQESKSDTLLFQEGLFYQKGDLNWNTDGTISMNLTHPDFPNVFGEAQFIKKPTVTVVKPLISEEGEFGNVIFSLGIKVEGFNEVKDPIMAVQLMGNSYLNYLGVKDLRFFTPGGRSIEESSEINYLGSVGYFTQLLGENTAEFELFFYSNSQIENSDTLFLGFSFLSEEAYLFETALLSQESNSGTGSSAVRIPNFLEGGKGVMYTTNFQELLIKGFSNTP
ncbi:MAG: hypothetical protein ACJAY8_001287 [Sphingobacteriales bacterium]